MNEDFVNLSFESRSSSPSIHFRVDEIIGERYCVISLLGEGGMSTAYKALDSKSGALVALKVLHPDRSNPKDLMRFEREAATARQLTHPSIARVFDFGLAPNKQPYLVMEYVEGQTLAARIQNEGQLPIDESLAIFISVCDALHYAHSQNILHRDIKPSNIMVCSSTNPALTVKLLDFGIAKLMPGSGVTTQQITETGELLGSPFYMSPEQARGGELDCRSDLYSLGSTLYEALTGGPPHLGQTPLATILKRETDKPTTLAEASLGRAFPERLELIVSKLLQTNPGDRYQDAAALKAALEQAKLSDKTVSAVSNKPLLVKTKPARTGVLVAGVFILAVLLAVPLTLIWLSGTHSLQSNRAIIKETSFPDSPSNLPEVKSLIAVQYITKAEERERKNDYAGAAHFYRRALDVYGSSSDRKSSESVLETLPKLAFCYRFGGQYKNASACDQKALEMSRHLYGENSTQFASALSSEGTGYLQERPLNLSQAWHKAEPLYERAIAICERLPSPYTKAVISLLQSQADVCLSLALPDEAIARYRKALDLCLKADPENITVRPGLICSLAKAYCAELRYEETKPLHTQLLAIFAHSTIAQQWQIAEYLSNFADDLGKMRGKTKFAKVILDDQQKLYEKAYLLYSELYGEFSEANYSKLGHIAQNIALTYAIQGELGLPEKNRTAEIWYRKARSNYEQESTVIPSRLADIDIALADLARVSKRYDESGFLANRAMLESKEAFGVKSEIYGSALSRLGMIKLQEGKVAAAEAIFRQVSQIWQKHMNQASDHDAYISVELARCKCSRGQFAEALKLFLRARSVYQKIAPYSAQLATTEEEIKMVRTALARGGY